MANKRIKDLPVATETTVGDILPIDGTTTRGITVENFLGDNLDAIKGLTSAADKGIQFTGAGTAATYDLTTAGKALLDDADAAAQRTTLGLVIGTNVQAYDADLDDWAGKAAPTGDAVGTTDTQTLTGKTIDLTDNTLSGTTAEFNAALSDGSFATLAGSETLTGKTFDIGDNTVTGTTAEFNSALSDGDFATLAGTETLTGKTISGASNTLSNVANSALSDMAAYTLKGNATGSGAAPTDISIPALTLKSSPVAGDMILLIDSADSNSLKHTTAAAVSGVGAVASLDGQTGAITTDLGLQNLSLAVSAAANALTIALKDASGNDPSVGSPAVINFRSATSTTGTIASLSVTAATSLVISSGSTLGVTSSTAFRLWIVGFNDAGTFRLGAVNVGGQTGRIYSLMEDIPTSSTAEGGAGAADSVGVFYTDSAVASKAYRILGYIEWGPSGVTAGAWTTSNLIRVQLFGYGIKKPGEVIQISQISTTIQTDNSTTSFVATNVALDMTLTSAANKVRISYNGGVVGNSTAAAPLVALHRGSAAVTTQIGPYQAHLPAAVAASIVPLAAEWLDFPNTTAGAYTVGVRSNAGGVVASFPYTGNSNVGIIRLEEIMC